ncbi:hypothetical protein V6N13_120432 [Hibiscus sabdariffa]|uniref:Uncharacterized protein n=1 Tax=Hibiscus sabdariffa TaxID=183260 RepID=A0ABR2E4T9_9ROSI
MDLFGQYLPETISCLIKLSTGEFSETFCSNQVVASLPLGLTRAVRVVFKKNQTKNILRNSIPPMGQVDQRRVFFDRNPRNNLNGSVSYLQ